MVHGVRTVFVCPFLNNVMLSRYLDLSLPGCRYSLARTGHQSSAWRSNLSRNGGSLSTSCAAGLYVTECTCTCALWQQSKRNLVFCRSSSSEFFNSFFFHPLHSPYFSFCAVYGGGMRVLQSYGGGQDEDANARRTPSTVRAIL